MASPSLRSRTRKRVCVRQNFMNRKNSVQYLSPYKAEDNRCDFFLPDTHMVPSLVKEASGLYTVKSTLFMKPTKADKDSEFQCTVEYSMPGDQNKQKKSNAININLNCECQEGMRV